MYNVINGNTENGVDFMKKKTAVIITIVALCAAIAFFAVPKISFYICDPTVYFNVKGYNRVETKLSAEDAQSIRRMFEGKSSYFDSPSCGFTENASIKIGFSTYMPACDGDEIVKSGLMYFNLSDKENKELRRILKKYGVDTLKAI